VKKDTRIEKLLSLLLWGMAVLIMVKGSGIFAKADGESPVGRQKKTQFHVVIDAGHGGVDPGKVGETGLEEKDVNLSIAYKLKDYLEMQNIAVTMTRTEDDLLVDCSEKGFKTRDMKKRVEILESAEPTIGISIHQNSYPSEKVRGAQVFYYEESASGKALAATLEQVLEERLDGEHRRTIKENKTYYMLKNTTVPTVIVECGFLSNRAEEALLATEEYRDRVAWSLHLGILRYLNEMNDGKESAG